MSRIFLSFKYSLFDFKKNPKINQKIRVKSFVEQKKQTKQPKIEFAIKNNPKIELYQIILLFIFVKISKSLQNDIDDEN